jgi:hypothetical protein
VGLKLFGAAGNIRSNEWKCFVGILVDRDRYALSQFEDLNHRFSSRSFVDQELLGDLLRQSEIIYSSSLEPEYEEVRAIPIQVHQSDSTSASVGRTLSDLDIELRRCASYMLRGSIQPMRDDQLVEVFSAQYVSSIDIVVVVAKGIYELLTSRPVDFLQALDWLWSHRLNRTKVRHANEEIDRRRIWDDVYRMGMECLDRGRPTTITIVIGADGSTKFGFESA